ncbi:MAG: hypothetical protein K8S16_21930 [Bacteroidales bacterium]|nr:hypothetical protein [Bacteroidales bacterium]
MNKDIKKIDTKKVPVVLIDKSLDFFNDKVLFPEKLTKANEMLMKIGLPKMNKAQ